MKFLSRTMREEPYQLFQLPNLSTFLPLKHLHPQPQTRHPRPWRSVIDINIPAGKTICWYPDTALCIEINIRTNISVESDTWINTEPFEVARPDNTGTSYKAVSIPAE